MKNSTSRSFIRRILLIGFFFIVIPLLIYSTLIWQRNWHLKLKSIFLEFDLTSDAVSNLYRQWLFFRVDQLDHFSQEGEAGLKGKYIFDPEGKCTFSTVKEIEGTTIYQEQVRQAMQKELLVFAGGEEIFVFKREGNEVRGLSVEATQWLTHLSLGRHFTLSLNGKSSPQTIEFTVKDLKNWQKQLSFSKAWQLRHHHLVMILPLPHATFDVNLRLAASEIAQIEGSPLFQDVLIFVLLILVIGGIGTWWLTRYMSASFVQLSKVMEAVSAKDYTKRYQRAKLGFEINRLGEHFNHMLDTLVGNMKLAQEERVAKELLTQELTITHDVQKGLLPTDIPTLSGLEWGMAFRPAKEVAGDFYDVFAKDKDHIMIVIADASGKGLSACLYSLILRSLLRSTALSQEGLSSALAHANELLIQDTEKTQDFVTAWVGFFNTQTKELTYASFGHPPALLLHPEGHIEELRTEGIALGVTPFGQQEVKTHTLKPKSLLLLYTDGVIEAQNKEGVLFGKSRLHQALKMGHQLYPQQLVDKLLEEVDTFAQKAPQHDDIALLSLKLS